VSLALILWQASDTYFRSTASNAFRNGNWWYKDAWGTTMSLVNKFETDKTWCHPTSMITRLVLTEEKYLCRLL
jgi:hypothetical protein